MLVISPHLDDAVFGCGDRIAAHPGCLVVTVFAGVPADRRRSTAWDRRCGFAEAGQAVAARRDEDRRALSLLEARPCWLGFVDSQYDEPATDDAIATALAEVLHAHATDEVLLPLGLFHADHLQVHRAARQALAQRPAAIDAVVYEDVPYRGVPGALQQRLVQLLDEGVRLTPARGIPAAPATAKPRAIEAYASQRRAFGPGGLADAGSAERYWFLERSDAADTGR